MEFTYGAPEVDLDALIPTACLFYGMNLGLPFSYRKDLLSKSYRFSSGFMERAELSLFNSWGWQLAAQFSSKTGIQTFVSNPMRASESQEQTPPRIDSYDDVTDGVAFFQTKYLTDLGLTFYLQPFETFDPCDLTTFGCYSENSKRLAVGDERDDEFHDSVDRLHMNDSFGEIFLRSFLLHLTS